MTQKNEIVNTLEGSLKILETALNEREQAQRALFYSCNVSKFDDIKETELYRLASELEDQIDRLKDLIDSIKWDLKYIGAFKEV